MARIITKEKAIKIAEKLGALLRETSSHSMAEIYEDGKLIATFGIRRSPNKEQGHDHVKNDLYITTHQAKLLAACPWQRTNWVNEMKSKGKILTTTDTTE